MTILSDFLRKLFRLRRCARDASRSYAVNVIDRRRGKSSDVGVKMTTGQSGHDHSLAIRQEIQRFESVHPSIYAIYDLIELVPDAHIAKQIREHVVAIEGT